MPRTDWTLVDDTYTSRDGQIRVSPQRGPGKKVSAWTVEVNGVFVGSQKRLDNAKQLGIEKRGSREEV